MPDPSAQPVRGPHGTDDRVDVPADPRDLEGQFHHRRQVEVRFADTDAMGHVNNALYHTYVESARTSYLEKVLGEPVRLGVHGELSFILAESRMVHRSPAFYGETLTVESRVTRIGRTSVTMEHRITAPDSQVGPRRLVAVCESVLVHYDYARNVPEPIDDEKLARFEGFENQTLRRSA